MGNSDRRYWQMPNEHWQDGICMSLILQAFAYRRAFEEGGHLRQESIMPKDWSKGLPQSLVKHYFDEHYQSTHKLPKEHFKDAVYLVNEINQTYGPEGLYRFFGLLSHESGGPADPTVEDIGFFTNVIKEIVAPRLFPTSKKETLHGISTIAQALLSLISGPANIPGTIVSGTEYTVLRSRRRKHYKNPDMDAVEKILPLLDDMHKVAQHALDIFEEIHENEREIPPLPPVNVTELQDIVLSCNSNNVAYSHPHRQ